VATAYSELLTLVRREGLLEPRTSHYVLLITADSIALVLGWGIFLLLEDSWWQVVTALFLAATFAQSAFLVHDAGHRQVMKSHLANDVFGMLYSNLFLGFAYGWWVKKHTRHHANPNNEDKDPDIVSKFIAFTPAQTRTTSRLRAWIFRNQALLLLPFSLFQALSMHAHSLGALGSGAYRRRTVEALLLGLHFMFYVGVVVATLSSVRAIVFVMVHQGALGLYLVCAFAPNHKGMPILADSDRLDFVRRQVLTSRNVRGGRVVSFLLGGLNYQIEHHLFPSMPRPNLRHAQASVRAHCLSHAIPYAEASLLESFGMVVRHLHAVGRIEA
jgi:fatty acid desaturase